MTFISPVCLGLGTSAKLYTVSGYDQYGQVTYNPVLLVKCAIVKINDLSQPSPIRSEASASHGRADEDFGDGTILVPFNTNVNNYDRIDIFNQTFQIINVSPQIDSFASVNHIQLTIKRIIVPVNLQFGST